MEVEGLSARKELFKIRDLIITRSKDTFDAWEEICVNWDEHWQWSKDHPPVWNIGNYVNGKAETHVHAESLGSRPPNLVFHPSNKFITSIDPQYIPSGLIRFYGILKLIRNRFNVVSLTWKPALSLQYPTKSLQHVSDHFWTIDLGDLLSRDGSEFYFADGIIPRWVRRIFRRRGVGFKVWYL